MQKYLHLLPQSIAILPYKTVMNMGGNLKSVAVRMEDKEQLDEIMKDTMPRIALDVFVGNTDTDNAYLYSATGPTVTDTDFTAKLCDVYPDGRSIIVVDGIIRASHRNSMEKRELMEPGEIYEFEIDLWPTSLVFSKGHRVRVAISSSNSPRFEPNPNTGKPSGVDDDMKTVTNTIYLDAEHPSHILLPVVSW